MSNFKKFSAYADVPCTWVREVIPDDDKVKQLKAKNVKLRAERDEWHRVAQSKQNIIDHMRDTNAANAKLRELASILCFCMQIHKQCDGCKLNGAKGEIAHDPLLACNGLHEMLQELEIEVP